MDTETLEINFRNYTKIGRRLHSSRMGFVRRKNRDNSSYGEICFYSCLSNRNIQSIYKISLFLQLLRLNFQMKVIFEITKMFKFDAFEM